MYKRRCYMVLGTCKEKITLREANSLFNNYITNKKRGHCVFHDHFLDVPGGIAFFEVNSKEQEETLYIKNELPDWELTIHPLILSRSASGFVYQLDYTSSQYGGVPISKL
jgi:hypothetical protein